MDGSHSSLLSPIRAPIGLAEERSAVSVEHCDTISSVQKQDSPAELKGCSLRPLREPAPESPIVEANDFPEELFITQALNDLKILGDLIFPVHIAGIPKTHHKLIGGIWIIIAKKRLENRQTAKMREKFDGI